jgi:hypothetical protein
VVVIAAAAGFGQATGGVGGCCAQHPGVQGHRHMRAEGMCFEYMPDVGLTALCACSWLSWQSFMPCHLLLLQLRRWLLVHALHPGCTECCIGTGLTPGALCVVVCSLRRP